MRLAALLVLVGCGSGIAFEDFAGEQRDARCGYFVRCGSISTIADCRTYYDSIAVDNKSLAGAIDEGWVHYDGDAAADCVEAFDTLPCDLTKQPADALAACDDVYTGTVKLNEPCAFDLECESERCVTPDCPDACCPGTCQPPRDLPGVDEPCTTLCEGDLFCGFDYLCHAPHLESDYCNAYTPCAANLYCSETTGLCQPLPKRGEYCELTCAAEGDLCNGGVCMPAGLANDPCTAGADCSRYYVCDLERGRCALPEPTTRDPNGTPCILNTDCQSHYCDMVCSDVPLCY